MTDQVLTALPEPGAQQVDAALQYEVQQFLFHEARLIDERRWREWLDLFEEDVRYWMPLRTNRPRREAHLELGKPEDVAHFDDGKEELEARVVRLGTGKAWAEEPTSRTRHLVTNVMVDAVDGDEADVTSYFLLYRNNSETNVDLWAGARHDRLRRRRTGWGIARRTIILDQAVILGRSLSVLF